MGIEFDQSGGGVGPPLPPASVVGDSWDDAAMVLSVAWLSPDITKTSAPTRIAAAVKM
jgi:hypothetical protein